jgi:hypothetical protein
MLFSFASPVHSEVIRLKSPRSGTATESAEGPAYTWRRNISPAMPAAWSLAGVAICTWGAFRLGQTSAFPGFLYLVFVVLAARYGGFWQATVVSVVAASCLDYFFVPPIFSFDMSPENWAALGAFELTSLIISRLSSNAQAVAKEAVAGRRDMERLYETSRRILLLNRSGEPGGPITGLIRDIFDLQTVTFFDAVPAATFQSRGTLLRLTPKEFDLLHYLMSHRGLPVPHSKLLQVVWGFGYGQELEYLRTFVHQLRRKLEHDPSSPEYLLTEHHFGYRFREATAVGPERP